MDTLPTWVSIELALLAIIVPAAIMIIGHAIRAERSQARFEAWMEHQEREFSETQRVVRGVARDLNRVMGKLGMNGGD